MVIRRVTSSSRRRKQLGRLYEIESKTYAIALVPINEVHVRDY